MQTEGTSAYCCSFFYSHTCSRVCEEMNCTTSQYFSLNRMLLLTIGLWPYQQSKLNRLQFILLFSILTTAVLFQFTTFITSKCTADLIIKVLPNAIFFTIFVIQYIFFAINTKTVKYFLTQLQHVYDQLLKDKHENAIIKKYSYTAKFYTTVLIILWVFATFILLVAQRSNIIDIILPLNASRSHRLPIIMEYFVDQEKYFLLILLHLNTAFCIGITVMVATGTMLIAYLTHVCGLFKISRQIIHSYHIEQAIRPSILYSYHIEQAMRPSIFKNISPKDNKLTKIILEEIIVAVHVHRQAMSLSKKLVSSFEGMLFCLIIAGVISLSLQLYQFFQIAKVKSNFDEIFLPFIFTIISIVYMFCANYMGQNVTDHNNHVFVTVYNIKWYIAPLFIQKMILFLLQRNTQDFTVGVGGLFVGSLECFATMVKASVSYFTVIYSME